MSAILLIRPHSASQPTTCLHWKNYSSPKSMVSQFISKQVLMLVSVTIQHTFQSDLYEIIFINLKWAFWMNRIWSCYHIEQRCIQARDYLCSFRSDYNGESCHFYFWILHYSRDLDKRLHFTFPSDKNMNDYIALTYNSNNNNNMLLI